MFNHLKLYNQNRIFHEPQIEYIEEDILIDQIDYYHSNSIARASKVMNDCRLAKIKLKKTGTEN